MIISAARLALVLLLALLPVSYCTAEPPPGSGETTSSQSVDDGATPQLIMLGVDAATPEVLDWLIGQGKLPNIARLIKSGAYSKMQSLDPPFSPVVWTTIATGMMPEQHGISSFTYTDKSTHQLRPTNALQRKVPALWNVASAAGLSVALSGYPVTWPPEKINGFVVSNYFFMPENTLDIGQLLDPAIQAMYPAELTKELASQLVPTDTITSRQLQKAHLQGLADNAVNLNVYSKDLSFFNSALYLLGHKSPDITMVYLQGVDVLGHENWPMFEYYRQATGGPPTAFRFHPGTLEAYRAENEPQPQLTSEEHQKLLQQGELLVHYYQFADSCLGQLLAKPSSRSRIVCLVSDHGFGPSAENRLVKTGDEAYTNPLVWHTSHGVFIISGPGIKQGLRFSSARVQDVFPTLVRALGLPVSKQLAGRVMTEIFEPQFDKSHPPAEIPSYDFEQQTATSSTVSSRMEEALMRQLKSLGYTR